MIGGSATTEQSTSPAAQGSQNGLATASLVTGIVGVVFAFLLAIVGLILGVVIVLGIVAIVAIVVNMVIAYNLLS